VQGAVLLRLGHLDHQAPPAVERAAGDVRAQPLVHRFGFAREVGFIDAAFAFDHLAVGRDQFPREDEDAVAGLQRGHRDDLLQAVRTQQTRLFGRFIEQSIDGAARPVHRVVLDGAGCAEEEEEQGAFLGVPDAPGADGGQDHQQVDVDPSLAERSPGVFRGVPTARQARQREQRRGRPRPCVRRRQEVPARERRESENAAGDGLGRDFFPLAGRFVVHAFLLRRDFRRVNLAAMDKGRNACIESAFTICRRASASRGKSAGRPSRNFLLRHRAKYLLLPEELPAT